MMSDTIVRSSISVVIPVRNDRGRLLVLLDALELQTVLPHELIIIDSSDGSQSCDLIHEKLNSGSTPYVYKQIQGSYAGRSINIGANLARGDYLGFLDTKTIPECFWISSCMEQFKCSTLGVVFGKTLFVGENNFQKLIKAASYGNIPHETVPGTVIRKQSWDKVGGFSETVRASYDIEWRNKVKILLNYSNAGDTCITYAAFPLNLLSATRKYFLYSFHTARTQAKNHIKQSYLSLFLLCMALVIPRWNYIIPGWDSNILYIPHVTKIFLLAIVFLFFVLIVIERLFTFTWENSIFRFLLRWIIFIFVSIGVYNWNGVFAGWVETATFYVPHITKSFLSLAAILFILFAGIIAPIRKNESVTYLFPFHWIMVALLRFYLDVIKAPGYIFGALICIFKTPKH